MDAGKHAKQSVWELLEGLSKVSEFVRRGVDEHPLDPVDVRLLALAEELGRLRPSHAASELGIASPSVTRHVRKLQADGHILIEPDPADGRSYLIGVTDKGADFLTGFRDELIDRMSVVLGDWPEQKIRTLAGLLGELGEAMDSARARRASRPPKNWWRQDASGPGETR